MSDMSEKASQALTKTELEEGATFAPRYDAQGLIPAIVTESGTDRVLMFAYMNAEALHKTVTSKQAHFWSRSRQALWRKGETSGDILDVDEIRTDCDQDVLWLRVRLRGQAACHTGRLSCFYRQVVSNEQNQLILFKLDTDQI